MTDPVRITYNGYSFDVIDAFRFYNDYDKVVISGHFLVQGSTKSEMLTEANNAEEALREPYKDLTLTFDSSAEHSYSHTSNTGMEAKSHVTKIDDDYSTLITRRYLFEYEANLPADASGLNFRKEGNFTVSRGASRQKIITFDLTYTASDDPFKTAEENFNDNAITYATSILSNFSPAVFELVEEDLAVDHLNKTARGMLQYEQLLTSDTSATTNDTRITQQEVSYSVQHTTALGATAIKTGFKQNPTPIIDIYHTSFLNSDEVVDIHAANDDLASMYIGIIRPSVVKKCSDLLNLELVVSDGSSGFVIIEDNYTFNPHLFAVTGKLKLICLRGTSITQIDEQIQVDTDTGKVNKKLWDKQENTFSEWLIGGITYVTRVLTVQSYFAPIIVPPKFTAEDLGFNSDEFLDLQRESVAGSREILGITKSSISGTGNTDLKEVQKFTRVFTQSFIVKKRKQQNPQGNGGTFS